MNLLDRYIVVSILKSVALVVVVLLGIFSFIDFVGQLDACRRGPDHAAALVTALTSLLTTTV